MIKIVKNDKSSGFYHVYADDVLDSHKNGQWWKDNGIIYLDQTHKYQNDIFEAIEEQIKH